ncbi:hypothetical protein NJT12_15930 [Flavobacterium sp. AC]|uniref:Uncharacterized protein n=1 Tax=Flavobacterium azizsancarii TaxID=2961580 RepID=A0ABT4WF60_9FLAO|nr:hypothetical protein [Flavobacterium azizsancarii]MDA6071105.1 hypothetical protein [Flavobacterium azizsancarii]
MITDDNKKYDTTNNHNANHPKQEDTTVNPEENFDENYSESEDFATD